MTHDPVRTQPTLSVVLPTHLGAGRVGACLTSLVNQSLAPSLFEVVVVHNGPADGTAAVVTAFASAHPAHRIRLLQIAESGAGRARNVGIAAAGGTWVTFVDDDDAVEPRFLEALLEAAQPGRVPTALVADVPHDAPARRTDDTYLNRRLLAPRAGSRVLDLLNAAASLNAGKLVLTEQARAVRYDESLRSGEDLVFWATLLVRHDLRVHVVQEPGSSYLRTVRERSVGRQGTDFDFAVDQRLACIQALQAIPRSTTLHRRLVSFLIQSQAMWVNRYLHQHLNDHERVVGAAHARGLERLPWRLLNQGLARDLAIAYCFTPFLDTSGLVAARRLRARATITDVVSHDLAAVRRRDEDSRTIAAPYVDQHHVVEGPAGFATWEVISDFVAETLAVVDGWQAEKGPYRTVYSRAMAVASHFAAAAVKIRNPAIRWTAEMSDPLRLNIEGAVREDPVRDGWLRDELGDALAALGHDDAARCSRLFEWAELVVYALADEIVFTNELQRKFMIDYCPDPALAERAWRISRSEGHPTLPERYYHLVPSAGDLDGSVVNIAYFGVFYPGRGLEEITAPFAGLRVSERRRVRLHVFTDRAQETALEVLRAGLADVVSVRPYVPYLEFLNLTTRFDALLVSDTSRTREHGVNPYLPSKASDYIGSGTPIWAMYDAGSALSDIATRFSSPLGDATAATAELRRILHELAPGAAA